MTEKRWKQPVQLWETGYVCTSMVMCVLCIREPALGMVWSATFWATGFHDDVAETILVSPTETGARGVRTPATCTLPTVSVYQASESAPHKSHTQPSSQELPQPSPCPPFNATRCVAAAVAEVVSYAPSLSAMLLDSRSEDLKKQNHTDLNGASGTTCLRSSFACHSKVHVCVFLLVRRHGVSS